MSKSSPLAWRGPVFSWVAILFGVGAVTWIGAREPGGFQAAAAMAIAAAMLVTLAFGLVGVGRNPALLRLVAGTAFLFLALMFLLSFTDLMTRLR
ncbi:MAG TPA: hypothetical protein VLI91_01380 [Roseiarcus sp.]|nr:hypothetical protein [Roseiarcus sp.]